MSKGSIQPKRGRSQAGTGPIIWCVCFRPDIIQGTLQTLGLLSSSPKTHEIVLSDGPKGQIARAVNMGSTRAFKPWAGSY